MDMNLFLSSAVWSNSDDLCRICRGICPHHKGPSRGCGKLYKEHWCFSEFFLSFMACSSILIQRKFSIDVGEPSLKNTYTQFRQWLKDRYGGEMSEDDKKIAVANVDEQLIEGETL